MARANIADFNKSLTPEERSAHARKAGSARKPRRKLNADIKKLAKMLNGSPASDDVKEALEARGIDIDNPSNAVAIAMSVMLNAMDGDMKAVEMWMKLVDQEEKPAAAGMGPVVNIICDIPHMVPEVGPGGEGDIDSPVSQTQ